jgi:serine phosphatase RsbU (regulator of sigma subunit)
MKEEFLAGKVIKWEVELAEEIQWKFLNKKNIDVPNFDLVAASRSAWEIWWDSYDIIKQKNNYYIYVWDATGHGVWAGFIMVMVNSLIEAFSRFLIKWDEILSNTNSILKPRLKANLLKTLLLVRYNSKEERLFMTWAWHEYLLIYKNSNKKCYKIKSWGVALWMLKDISKFLKEREVRLEKDDIIVLYSDWITEAINQAERDWNEQMFWEERLIKAIENSPEIYWEWYKTAQSVFNNITIELSKFMWYKYKQFDDITLVVMHYKKDRIIPEQKALDKTLITEWNWEKKK